MRFCGLGIGAVLWMAMSVAAQQVQSPLGPPPPPEIIAGKKALAAKDFVGAKRIFAGYLKEHSKDEQARLGVADAELALHEYESAELEYRELVAANPQLWQAHKNLVITEAALGRWEDFDGERKVLRAARDRGSKGTDPRDIDVIDVVLVRPLKGGEERRWIVREYYEPLGRARVRLNFERFSRDGRAEAYVSLESAGALGVELKSQDKVMVGQGMKVAAAKESLALDFYDGKSHGTIHTYEAEPTYEQLRAEFLRWARRHG